MTQALRANGEHEVRPRTAKKGKAQRVRCSCGWRSRYGYRTQRSAGIRAQLHLAEAFREAVGVPQ